MNGPSEIIKEFLVESHENLGRLDQDLIVLEKGPASPATLGSIFRTMHTLKGSAGFLGFHRLESLTHVAESLLSRLRDGKLAVTSEIVSALLATGDAVREMLGALESSGAESQYDFAELIARLNTLRGDGATASGATTRLPITESLDLTFPGASAAPTVAASNATVSSPSQPTRGSDSSLSPEAPVAAESAASKVTDSTIRLDVARVDKLLNLVSELVLARNQILQHTLVQNEPSLAGAARNLNLITSELQEVAMSARMQPIGNIWSQFPRIVRDLALECGKRVRLEMSGSQTELDKTVIEAMKDPLTHLVRNAIDHGLESPEVRTAAGKPAEGRLLLRAYHESGQIHIEISDDGAGIDGALVKRRAIERGLINADQAADLSERLVLELIFLPGFSTSEHVSHVSGRGVGMDVVRNNVERIGGTVDVQSTLGVGTTVKMRIPLTLAIIRALMIATAGQRYAIPQASMIELIRLDGDKARTNIERIHGASVYRFRGKLLPLMYLNRILGGACDNNSDIVNIAVLQADEQQFGLVVDHISDTQEIVVKPLNKMLRGVTCLAGATILGDGRVALILDVLGLAKRATGIARVASSAMLETEPAPAPVEAGGQQLVLVRGAGNEPMAVPLQMVARLEEIPASAVEWTGSRPVMQYRGNILPLVDVHGSWRQNGKTSSDPSASIHVVVCTDGRRSIGLVVDRILDIVSDPMQVRGRATRGHVLCTAVLQRQVTEVLDVAGLIESSESMLMDSELMTKETQYEF